MTLQEKIIELLPEEKEKPQGIQNAGTILPIFGYNQALQDVKEKLPEILKLIREEVVQEILIECQKDVDFGAQQQQIVSTKGLVKCLVFLELLK